MGEFLDETIYSIGKSIVHLLAVGHADLTGDDFANLFAHSISGDHRDSPLGITDVVWESCSWSAKTVKSSKPFSQQSVRLISGRNSPGYSCGITDPLADIGATGRAVLDIWNERVNQSLNEYDDLRIIVLMRNMDTLNFGLFEYEAVRYVTADYEWRVNGRGNLEGIDRTTQGHCFTWQPHGSQFTVIKAVPASVHKFRINRHPGLIEPRHILQLIHYRDDWIDILK